MMHEQHGAGATECERRWSDSSVRRIRRVVLLARMPAALNALNEILTEAGYLVRVASELDGAEGLIARVRPHALLVDLDAWGPAHRLHWALTGGCPKHPPIIGMALEVMAADHPLAALLLKPIDVGVLLATVARIVNESIDALAGDTLDAARGS